MREAEPIDVSKIKRIEIQIKPKYVEYVKVPDKLDESVFQAMLNKMPYYILVYGEDVLKKFAEYAPLPAPINTILKYTGKAITYVAKHIGVKK